MRAKLLMRWNVNNRNETDYYEFIVKEFVPRVKRLGISDVEFWYTAYGECEQMQASGITRTVEQMNNILASDEWEQLRTQLFDYVNNYSQKLIMATGGFQI